MPPSRGDPTRRVLSSTPPATDCRPFPASARVRETAAAARTNDHQRAHTTAARSPRRAPRHRSGKRHRDPDTADEETIEDPSHPLHDPEANLDSATFHVPLADYFEFDRPPQQRDQRLRIRRVEQRPSAWIQRAGNVSDDATIQPIEIAILGAQPERQVR